jgi:hypothetical protein
MNHIQSIPFPESKHPAIAAAPVEAETVPTQAPLSTTEQTLEAVEKMTPVQKAKEKVEAEANSEGQQKATEEKKKEFEGQLTQLEATFTLDKINLHIDEAIHENNEDQPFLCLSLQSIVANTKIKTFDMKFNASLGDFIVYHQQFVGKDNQQLRLLSAQLDKKNPEENKKLVSLEFLHTSQENPLFSSEPYNGTENQASVRLTKLVINLQLEALLSILRFQDSLMKKLSKDTPQDQAKQKQEQKIAEEKKTNDNAGKVVKKTGEIL